MAKNASSSPSTSDNGSPKVETWQPPDSDQEFEFESVDAAPAWIDKGWASFSQGPALAVPQGSLDFSGPYHTTYARVGDTVKFTAAKGATPAKLTVIQGEPDPAKGHATKKPPQQSAAALEDMLRTGFISADDLGEDAKAQVTARSTGMGRYIEKGGKQLAEPQKISDIVKTD